jgi:hypothetical protein
MENNKRKAKLKHFKLPELTIIAGKVHTKYTKIIRMKRTRDIIKTESNYILKRKIII